MKQDSATWKFRTQKSDDIIYSEFEENLEDFMESIVYILYIISKLGKSGVNVSNDLQIEAKMKKLWPFEDNCIELEGHFKMISKFNL